MDVDFADDDLLRLYTDSAYNGRFSTDIIKAFRRKVAFIMNAPDERTIREWRSLNYEQLQGRRQHEWSIRLNGAWRIILQQRVTDQGITLVVVNVEQYH